MENNRLKFQPLRIRAYLQCGVISDQFLPLDGILYNQHIRQERGEKQVYSTPGGSCIRNCDSKLLPISKAGPRNEAWFYACSFAQWPQNTIEDKQAYAKRIDINYSDLIDFGKRQGKIDVSRGQYKSYWINVYYRHALYVDWYCSADKEELEKLLRFCTHIGKKTAQGWGAVLRWEITEWPEDWSIRNSQNRLMRAVPVMGNGYLYGIRPSYWNSRHQFNCKMPD